MKKILMYKDLKEEEKKYYIKGTTGEALKKNRLYLQETTKEEKYKIIKKFEELAINTIHMLEEKLKKEYNIKLVEKTLYNSNYINNIINDLVTDIYDVDIYDINSVVDYYYEQTINEGVFDNCINKLLRRAV